MKSVTANQIGTWNGRIIDVRNVDEFVNERLATAECVPLSHLASAAAAWSVKEPLLLMCKTGMRSTQAAQQLEQAGFQNVSMLDGGIEACKRAGLDVVRNRKRIPLYRQVMIGAGLVLLAALVLSLWHVSFVWLAWFVGAMLVFGGITGYCPMAAMLCRAPWNADLTNSGHILHGVTSCPSRAS